MALSSLEINGPFAELASLKACHPRTLAGKKFTIVGTHAPYSKSELATLITCLSGTFVSFSSASREVNYAVIGSHVDPVATARIVDLGITGINLRNLFTDIETWSARAQKRDVDDGGEQGVSKRTRVS